MRIESQKFGLSSMRAKIRCTGGEVMVCCFRSDLLQDFFDSVEGISW